MSIIVAVKKDNKTVIAADSQITFGSMIMPQSNLSSAKIRKVGQSWFSSTGWGLYDDIIENFILDKPEIELLTRNQIFDFFLSLWKALHDKYNFVNDQSDDDHESPFGDLDASFLLANKNGIFLVDSDLSITEFQQYYAIGSGCDYSIGTIYTLYEKDLDAEQIAISAIKTAVAFDTKCGGEIMLRSIEC